MSAFLGHRKDKEYSGAQRLKGKVSSKYKPSKSAERASKYKEIKRIVESNYDSENPRKDVINPNFRINTDFTLKKFAEK